MDDRDSLTAQFEANRTRLRSVAFRMLGTAGDADDAVQETWIRLHRADGAAIENLGGWLTTVVARVCLDRLRARRAKPEDALDDAVAVGTTATTDDDPAEYAVVADSVGTALMLVLDTLTPAERVAFVLHDVFAVPYSDIAPIIDRSTDATRQLASRARRRVRGTPSTAELDLVRQRQVVDAFLRAARGGDFDALLTLLDPDVELRPDAAAVRMGSLRPTRGNREIAGLISGGARAAKLAILNGMAGLVWAPGGHVRGTVHVTVVDGRITALDVTGDIDRIRELDIVVLDT